MKPKMVQCEWCGKDKYPRELRYSRKMDANVCADCDADKDRRTEREEKRR